MKVRQILLALSILGITAGLVLPVSASALSPVEAPKSKGLYIAPLRNYLAANAGETVTRAFTVANRTDQPITITTSLEEFSVADYTYDYRFDKVDNNWVQLVERSFILKPFESREVPYRITLPPDASPGGYYYTLYASSTVQNESTNSTLRAASLLYLTVNGELQRSSQVVGRVIPWIVINPQINYTLDIKNTGNIHYFGYLASSVRGLFYHDTPNGTSQLLMPGTTRHIENSIRSPLIPGIYKLNYAYTPDEGQTINGSQYFLFLPPWSIALLIIVVTVVARILIPRLYKRRAKTNNA